MKPPPFDYHAPGDVGEACKLLAELDNAKLLAGGQSLLPMLNMRIVFPDHLIDINELNELAYIREANPRLELGAMTRQHELLASELIAARCPLLSEALTHIGHRQTRNRGTLGGSLCHLDPAAELPVVMLALEASIVARSVRGERRIAMAQFPAFYMTPAIELDEIVTGVDFKCWASGHGAAFVEYARRHGDFALVACAAMLEVDASATVTRAAVCLGGVGTGPLRCPEVEAAVVGTKAQAAQIEAAVRPCADIDAMHDVHASRDYRRHLATTLAARALTSAYSRAQGTASD